MSYVAFPPVAPDLFGPMLSGRDVRDALLATIQTWSAGYIAEQSLQYELPMQPFGTWEAQYENRALPPGEIAACWATCTTTDPRRPPEKQGDGSYRAIWIAAAELAVYGTDWQESVDLMAAYMSAVRTCILQHGSLGGFAANTRWLGEATKEIEHQRTRTVQHGQVLFAVTVENVVNVDAGPKTAPVPPGSAGGPTVATTNVTVDNYEPDAGLPED